jgi:dienelactone hydrolase
LEPFVGTYRAPDRDVMVARPYTYVMFLDTKTGRMGFLWPSGLDTFVTGPSKGIHFPFVATFRFTRDPSGGVRAVDVAFAKDTAIHATRVPSFRSRPLDFTNEAATLRGTFFLPDGNPPFPAVMLLAGSNYQTRSAQNAFFSWVGDVFLKHGFAVYAYDKRGADFSTGERSDGFVVSDAVKGFEAMARQPEVRASCMGIWGISQGGMTAPKVATTTPGIAFIANTSGAVVNGNVQEIQRTALEMRADGFRENEIADAVRLQTLKFDYAMTGKGWDEYIAAYHAYEHRAWFPDPYVGPPSDPKSPAFAFWAQEGDKAPADYWKQFHGQVLYIDGEHETNQDRAANFEAFVGAMKTARNTTYETDVVPGADHSMLIDPRGGNTIDRLLTNFAIGYFSSLGRWIDTVACAKR